MEAKFTPGPWHVEPEEASDHHGLVICATDAIVATITPEEHGPDLDAIDRANARLIAAAPDLLAALEEIQTWLIAPVTDSTTIGLFRSVVRGAIDLTRGGE